MWIWIRNQFSPRMVPYNRGYRWRPLCRHTGVEDRCCHHRGHHGQQILPRWFWLSDPRSSWKIRTVSNICRRCEVHWTVSRVGWKPNIQHILVVLHQKEPKKQKINEKENLSKIPSTPPHLLHQHLCMRRSKKKLEKEEVGSSFQNNLCRIVGENQSKMILQKYVLLCCKLELPEKYKYWPIRAFKGVKFKSLLSTD